MLMMKFITGSFFKLHLPHPCKKLMHLLLMAPSLDISGILKRMRMEGRS